MELPVGKDIAVDEPVPGHRRRLPSGQPRRPARGPPDLMVEEPPRRFQQAVEDLEVLGEAGQPDVFEHADRADRIKALTRQVPVVLEPDLDLVGQAGLGHHQAGGLGQLGRVGARRGHRFRDGMGAEDDPVLGRSRVAGRLLDGLADGDGHVAAHRFDEPGVVVEQPDLVELGGARTDRIPGPLQVFAVLAAAGIGAEGRCGEHQRPLDPIGGHLGHRVGQHRMPVAVAPVDREIDAGTAELGFDGGLQVPAVIVDRGSTAELGVLLGNDGQSLIGHVAALGHVAEEGEDVVGAFGSTEGQQQDRVDVWVWHGGDGTEAAAAAR